ncbi:hypothetical protein QBC32DRAFT_366036 [Pseudoneurospora amorphoporcata]|uniref:Uncharacterized protein n=1 Tax=Pseudoneurospora amorphoporcata TaxID=241081 RepID=A0AAN6SBH4_9PEZI|nr:hypothetical protein QBC32DRAFT_366036 [Pseudoneurospora amorphoporcata]
MHDFGRQKAFQGSGSDPAKDCMPPQTIFGGYHEPYPVFELLENNTTPSPYIGHAHDTALLIADTIYDKNDSYFDDIVHDSHDFHFNAKKIGHSRIVTDDLIDPVLLHWDADHKTAISPPFIASVEPIREASAKATIDFVLNNAPINSTQPSFGFPNNSTTVMAQTTFRGTNGGMSDAGTFTNAIFTTATFAACNNLPNDATSGHHAVAKPARTPHNNAKTTCKSNKKRSTGPKLAAVTRVPGMCYDCTVRPF